MLAKYLNPQNDLAFRRIFGQTKHKNIPISFLNAVFKLTGKDTIVDLEFINTIQPPEIESRKESIVDVIVEDQTGAKYIVEMQVAKTEGFEKRAQFYAAKTYCSHFNVGEPYINLKKVIFLAITTYTLFKDKEHYKSDHKILDDQTYQNDLKDFFFTFVELPKFTKTLPDLKTIEEKWYYFLKHAEETNDIDATLASNPEIKEAYAVLERTGWTEQALMEYERIAMAVADTKGAISAAKKEGLEEGLQKGLEEGLQKGQKRQQIAMAIKLLQQRYSIEKVAELTDLDLAELADLENKETKMSEL